MKIAAIQMVSTPDVERNCATARELVGAAARDGARLAVLPEYFCFMGRSDRDKLAIAETPGDGPIQRTLAETAREHRLFPGKLDKGFRPSPFLPEDHPQRATQPT